VSDTFAWEVKRHNGFEFKVLFPSKGDLAKMTKFNAEMKEGVTLKLLEFKEDEEYYEHALPMVWMRVINLPTILREYAILWALGTLLLCYTGCGYGDY
jgi:predicted alpha/beta-fold hydrolase